MFARTRRPVADAQATDRGGQVVPDGRKGDELGHHAPSGVDPPPTEQEECLCLDVVESVATGRVSFVVVAVEKPERSTAGRHTLDNIEAQTLLLLGGRE